MRLTKPRKFSIAGKADRDVKPNSVKALPSPIERKSGNNNKYKKEYAEIASAACSELGATVADLAKLFHCSIPTMYNWQTNHAEFYAAVKKGMDFYASEHVENSLFQRARGYDKQIVEEKAVTQTKLEGKRLIKYTEIIPLRRTVHVPADVGAAEFWLCNRNGARWKSMNNSKYQQLNLFPGVQPGANGKGETEADAKQHEIKVLREFQEVACALRDAGAFEIIPGPEGDKGPNTKTN